MPSSSLTAEAVPAASLGPAAFPWWRDWRGLSVAIIASGPSTKKDEVALLSHRLPVIAIKENYDIAMWSDVVYGCDAAWWRNRNGLHDFHGLKVSADRRLNYPDVRMVSVGQSEDRMLFDTPGVLGAGGNSGFQALNLAVQFGATRVLLIGFDVGDRSGVHWYGRNNGPGRSNPSEVNFARWRRAFTSAAKPLMDRGIEVVNASDLSTLTCFRRVRVRETLQDWGCL